MRSLRTHQGKSDGSLGENTPTISASRSRNPSVLTRAIPTFHVLLVTLSAKQKKSQSLRTHQGNSDEDRKERKDKWKVNPSSRNPSVLTRAIPTARQTPNRQVVVFRSRNPSVLTRAIPTVGPRLPWGIKENRKSQSLRTHQGNSDCGLSSSLIPGDLRCPFLWTPVFGLSGSSSELFTAGSLLIQPADFIDFVPRL